MDNQGPNNYNNYNNYNNNNNNNNRNNGNNNGNNGNNNGNNGKNNKNSQMIMGFILVSLIALFIVSLVTDKFSDLSTKETTYNEFWAQLENNNVKSVEIGTHEISYTLVKDQTKLEIRYYTGIVNDSELIKKIKTSKTSDNKPIELSATIPDNTSALVLNILSFIIPLVVLWILFGFLARKMGGSMGMGVGKSNAKVYVEKSTGVTFKDVAGQD